MNKLMTWKDFEDLVHQGKPIDSLLQEQGQGDADATSGTLINFEATLQLLWLCCFWHDGEWVCCIIFTLH